MKIIRKTISTKVGNKVVTEIYEPTTKPSDDTSVILLVSTILVTFGFMIFLMTLGFTI